MSGVVVALKGRSRIDMIAIGRMGGQLGELDQLRWSSIGRLVEEREGKVRRDKRWDEGGRKGGEEGM
jgi:hypothetical protein